MRWLLVLLGVVSWSPARAQVTGEIVQFGETSIQRSAVGTRRDEGTGLAPAEAASGVRYLNGSNHIEAALCRSFSATIRLAAPGGVVPRRLLVRTRHPLMRREDGATSVENDFPTFVNGTTSNAGFTFDHAWEMVPGDWEIGFYYKGALLAAQRFVVTAPVGGVGSVCEGLSS